MDRLPEIGAVDDLDEVLGRRSVAVAGVEPLKFGRARRDARHLDAARRRRQFWSPVRSTRNFEIKKRSLKYTVPRSTHSQLN